MKAKKTYKNGGRRKKANYGFFERNFYGRKKAADDRRKKIDRGIARLEDPEREPSTTVIIAADPKDEAKLQRKSMKLKEVNRRRTNRGTSARKGRGKGLGGRRSRKLQRAVNDMKVHNRKAFFEEQKKIRDANKPNTDTSGLFIKK